MATIRVYLLGFVLLSATLLISCSERNANIDSANGGLEPAVTMVVGTATPDYSAYRQAWQEGPHAATYALEKGPNTYCARCHSPGNWDPAAKVDPPPNCVSCKFPFEAEPRIATGNPLVPEQEWESIGCEVCHPVDANGVAQGEIAWHDTVSGYYETVADSADLCSRCHRDTETLRHSRDLGEAAHAGYTCTECHDAHSTVTSCDAQGCHAADDAAWAGHHDAHHDMVACVACHDAAGLQVGPLEDGSLWMTFRTTELLGRASTAPYQSHQLQREVNCQRCHYPDNPWQLRVETADG